MMQCMLLRNIHAQCRDVVSHKFTERLIQVRYKQKLGTMFDSARDMKNEMHTRCS